MSRDEILATMLLYFHNPAPDAKAVQKMHCHWCTVAIIITVKPGCYDLIYVDTVELPVSSGMSSGHRSPLMHCSLTVTVTIGLQGRLYPNLIGNNRRLHDRFYCIVACASKMHPAPTSLSVSSEVQHCRAHMAPLNCGRTQQTCCQCTIDMPTGCIQHSATPLDRYCPCCRLPASAA